MADRTSASIFSQLFVMLAEEPTDSNKEMANKIYKLSYGYDFHHCQMDCNDELIKLGLAKIGIDPEYPEEGEVIIYRGKEKFK